MKESFLESENKQPNMIVPKRTISKIIKIAIILTILVSILIIVTVVTTYNSSYKFKNTPVHSFSAIFQKEESFAFDESTGTLTFKDIHSREEYLSIYVPHKIKKSISKTSCEFVDKSKADQAQRVREPSNHQDKLTPEDESHLCLSFKNEIQLAVYRDSVGVQCHTVHWYSRNKETEIINCVNFAGDNWYGGGSLSVQRWPLNRVNVPEQPYLTRKFKPDQTDEAKFDSFIEPYFISASGTVIQVDAYLPLFVSINHNHDKKLCFRSAYETPYNLYQYTSDSISLKYRVCKDRVGRVAHWHSLESKILDHPPISPPEELLKKPIWSTRGINTNNISQVLVLALVRNIKNNRLPFNQLFVDGNYSKSNGNYYFNEKRFPNSHQMIMEFQSNHGVDKLFVGTEVFPHVPDFIELINYSIKFREYKSNLSFPLNLDISNRQAISWYTSQLKDIFNELTIKGFRFSGGQASEILREDTHFDLYNASFHLNMLTYSYAAIAREFGNRCLIGSGYKSQNYTAIADAGPMLASWEHNKGLKSIIPTTLTYGLMGYPFVLTGPVGGVNMIEKTFAGNFSPSDKELFIRWLQLAIFLPVIEISVGPWHYGDDVVNYTRKLLEYREKELWPKYLSAATSEAIQVGTPIARPLWFIFPDDKTAQFIDCEFFVSNSLLVAPVLYPGARQRDIYLPEGLWWKDLLHDKYYSGGQWLRNFPVDLYEIATFIQERPQKSEVLK
ncbi:hypothetical protein Btru_004046 [Bulinus truncatus]|nr:hypothetical protein Btru_004046 [Bulinus truncatus]